MKFIHDISYRYHILRLYTFSTNCGEMVYSKWTTGLFFKKFFFLMKTCRSTTSTCTKPASSETVNCNVPMQVDILWHGDS